MNNIGILSGGGKLPLAIGENLIKIGYNVRFFCIDPFVKISDYKKFDTTIIKLNSLSAIMKTLNNNNINKIIMAGNIKRPSLKDIQFDLYTIKLIKDFALSSKGDDRLLSTISIFFKKHNYEFFDWRHYCNDLFVRDKFLTKNKPNQISINNLNKGLNIFKIIGKADLSQSLIIQNNLILGLEAAEGTDELIKRCYKYKNSGDKGVLLKLSKYKQNYNFDLPVIGLNTAKLLKKYDYEGMFVEKNHCIILERNAVINYCNNNSLFISGINKI